MSRYYVTTHEYVGPPCSPAPRDTVRISTEPPRTNISHEVRTEGWLGTTDDWAEYAHGAYDSAEEAEAYIRAHWDVYELPDWRYDDPDPDTVLLLGIGDHDPRDEWDAADWLAPSTLEDHGLSASSTDEEIEAAAERLAGEAATDEQWITDGADGIAAVLRRWRDEARSAEAADTTIYVLEIPHQGPPTAWTVDDEDEVIEEAIRRYDQLRLDEAVAECGGDDFDGAVQLLGHDLHALHVYRGAAEAREGAALLSGHQADAARAALLHEVARTVEV